MKQKKQKTAFELAGEAITQAAMNMGSLAVRVKRVYVNRNTRIIAVQWLDDSKTVVKCQPEDDFSVDVGVALAYCYKFFGSKTKFRKVIQEHIKEVK